ncbi:MAG: RNA polymerase sigma factor [Bdellovibrionales bacterium]|nr:RNA polymerase sigma factor [Bdellovibrionales bacterium]
MADEDQDLCELIVMAQGGDEQSIRQIVERTQTKLYKFLFYLTNNQSTAQDLTQDTYIRIFSSLKDLKDPRTFTSWSYRIAKNLFLDSVKTQKGQIENTMEEWNEASMGESEHQSDDLILLRQGLEALEEEQRIVILLVDLQGYSYAEAGEILGASENAVRSRLHRARASLSEILQTKMETKQASGSS